MSSRRASDKANAVSLFPFLAVLLCTMGSLLVLLVVLAQRASEQAALKSAAAQESAKAVASPRRTPPEDYTDELAEVRVRREALDRARDEVEQRLRENKQRLAHIEEHNRRIEHDLAKLHIANEQLKAAESSQQVDQEQAERELARLEEIIKETQQQLEMARKDAAGRRGKTVVVYRGPNGTERPPIYIECHANGVTLQPEGVPLELADLDKELRAGNALALAIRATQDYAAKNNEADNNGRSEDSAVPYPLVLVRPGGRLQFNAVVGALGAADLPYGYEFMGSEADLQYPAADPQLARLQQHAVMQARARQELLAKSAPSRFGGHRRVGGRGQGGGAGDGRGTRSGASERNLLSGNSGGDSTLGASQGRYGHADAGEGEFAGHHAGHTEDGGGSGGSDGHSRGTAAFADSESPTTANDSALAASGSGGGETADESAQSPATTGGRQAFAQTDGQGSGSNGSASSGQAGGSPGGGAGQQRANGSSRSSDATQSFSAQAQAESAAAVRGSNWAVEKTRGHAVAMRRPISVAVQRDRLIVLPSRHASTAALAPIATIPLNQPADRVLDEFAAAVRRHMDDWGLAGRGMVWRPVLELQVSPGAAAQARSLQRALEGSGIDVNLPKTADGRDGGIPHATR